MSKELTIRKKELFDNPTPRVPIALVLDTSGSMFGEPIDELNMGVKMFLEEMAGNPYTRTSAEVCIVTFDSYAKCVSDFQNIENQTCDTLYAEGSTSMNDGVNLALDKLSKVKAEFKNSGVEYYQPWMILMTDGAPTQAIDDSSARTTELVNEKKLVVFPVGIGDEADMDELARYSPKTQPLKLQGLKFAEFFEWLSASAVKVSSESQPGDKIKLDLEGLKGWAEL